VKRAFSRKNLWENAPPSLRKIAGVVLDLVPQPYLLGGAFRRTLAFVEQAQWWSGEQARQYQLEQLRRTLDLAYHNTAYYSRSFDEVGFVPGDLKRLEDMRRLPLIDKNILREHLDEMCATAVDSPDVDYTSTGGSSGTPLQFYIGSGRSSIEYAYLVSGFKRVGYDFGMKLAVFRGHVPPEGGRYEYDSVLRRCYYNNFSMTPDNLAFYFEHLRTIGQCFLHVYPSSAMVLARYLESTGCEVPDNILGILAGSETVFPDQRAFVSDVFNRRYYSWYGHSEKLVLGAECERSEDYHVFPTYGYCELLDADDNPITTPGEVGEIVGTGFINKVVPFVRYRTGDHAEYVGDRCEACGRQHMIIKNVQGRWPQGGLVGADGTSISLTALNLHDDTFKNVRQYQFYQDTPGEAVLRVLPLREITQEDLEAIREAMVTRLAGEVELTVKIVDNLPVTKAGKLKLIDQHVDQPREEIALPVVGMTR